MIKRINSKSLSTFFSIKKKIKAVKKKRITFIGKKHNSDKIVLQKMLIGNQGLNFYKAQKICKQFNIYNGTVLHFFNEDQLVLLERHLSLLKSDLDQCISASNLPLLTSLGFRRGIRVYKGLPARGQRTHTNRKRCRRRTARFRFIAHIKS